ncbi:MAG: helix-turn-helix domain-containing protein [Defluviimonas sp.]|nr:helix-turn-helix domain-containing protein [Rhodobiaceae bacterium]MCC0065412.1 helix-turn-helix domain-containing protein [Defluviimonas sp.]
MPKRTPAGWHRADIIAAIHKRGETLVSLAKANGYAESTLRSGLHYPIKSQHVLIAEFIGESLHAIWPQWYAPDGTQLMTRAEATKQARSLRVQKARNSRHSKAAPLTAEGVA